MPRKGENIRKRIDGRWEGRYPVWNEEKGRNVTKSVYARTYAEAKEKLAAAKVKCQQERLLHHAAEMDGTAEDMPCDMIVSAWLSQIRETKKYSTYVKYSQIYETHLRSIFSDMSSKEISVEQISAQMSALKPSSWSLTKSIYSVANLILQFAHEHCGTPYYRISPTKKYVKAEPVETLTRSEQARLLNVLYAKSQIGTDRYGFGILICLYTGVRIGEICSLKWSDIDLDGGLLYVNRTVQRIRVEGQDTKTALLEDEPKSATSKREIPLPDDIVLLLKSIHDADPLNDYVIRGNRPAEPRTMYNHYLKCLEEASIEKKHFHCLRHTFATNCINAGVDVKSLSEILGHADVSITLNRYVHPTIETKRKHMNTLSDIMGQYLGQGCKKIA